MVVSNVTWSVIEDPFSASQHDRPNLTNWGMNHTIRINLSEIGIGYRAEHGGRCVGGVSGAVTTLPQIVAHELFGHGGHVVRNRGLFGLPGPMTTNENEAMTWERKYSAAARQPGRCDHAVQ
jgi:hypothetical protein